MNNFGVIEVASAKTTHAPGWAYVPDTATSSIPSQSVSAVHLHVSRKKRAARNAATASDPNSSTAAAAAAAAQEGISARHGAKLAKEIEQLQRDSLGGRDAHVAVPSSSGGGGRDKDKDRGHTPNVRKILASQKTFANHLDDFEAWSRAQGEGGPRGAGQAVEGTPGPGAPVGGGAGGGGGGRRGAQAQKKGGASAARGKGPANSSKKSATPAPAPTPDPDVVMTDAPPHPSTKTAAADNTTQDDGPATHTTEEEDDPTSHLLAPRARAAPPPCPGDSDPLLESWLPPAPTAEELRELVRAPPLGYHQARGAWGAPGGERRYPARQFCGVCGYWGRVRCGKCGARVCALDCLDVHREECVTRYGL